MRAKKKVEPDPETCEHCKHFVGNEDDQYGYCKRFPPVAVVDEGSQEWSQPVVMESETCGEFKRRLNS